VLLRRQAVSGALTPRTPFGVAPHRKPCQQSTVGLCCFVRATYIDRHLPAGPTRAQLTAHKFGVALLLLAGLSGPGTRAALRWWCPHPSSSFLPSGGGRGSEVHVCAGSRRARARAALTHLGVSASDKPRAPRSHQRPVDVAAATTEYPRVRGRSSRTCLGWLPMPSISVAASFSQALEAQPRACSRPH